MLRSSLTLLILLGGTASVRGQSRGPYVGGNVLLSTQDSERPGSSPSFPTTGVGGTAFGVSVEAGGFLAPHLSIAFEASVPRRFDAVQETDYFLVFRTDNEHRDLVMSGLFHVHAPAAGPLRFAVVGGPSLVREDTLQRTAYKTGPPLGVTGDFGPFSDPTPLTRWTVGVTGGADAEIRVGQHVSVVPEFRGHWVKRVESGDGASGMLGLAAWIWRPAVGVRATF